MVMSGICKKPSPLKPSHSNGWTYLRLVFGAVCVFVAGCVSPGRIDENLIARYQKSMLARSPQQRAGEKGLDLLRPAADPKAEPFKTVKDSLTEMDGVSLSLEQAVRLALANSLDIRVVSFDPAISREEMVQAAAEFDWVVFAGASHTRTDHHTATALPYYKARSIPVEVGVRKKTVTGGEAELAWDLTRTSDNSALMMLNPNYESIASLSLTQPLLRGAWPDYNLAGLRIARLGHKVAHSQFRQEVEKIVAQVQTTYWALVQARRDMEIQDLLLKKTIETRDRVRGRRGLDATDVEVKQAEAAVETRRAILIRARKVVFDVQEKLARLLADTRMSPLRRYVIVPATPPVTSKVDIDPTDQMVNALRYSPVLEQARLAIAAADIRVSVAKNETLPTLDLTASVGIQGMKDVGGKAAGDMLTFDYLDHSIGLMFEYPLGNRAAKAALRQRRFERLKSVTQLQDAADRLAMDVNEVIRQIQTAYQEMQAQKAAVAASLAQLKALEDTERIRGRLTPEFLNLKLQSQGYLAAAARAEIQATVDFNAALARLAQITGTTLQQKNIKLAVEDSSR